MRVRALAALLPVALLMAACGDDDDSAGAGDATTSVAAATSGTSAAAETTAPAADDVDPAGVLRVGVDLAGSGGLRFDPTKMSTGQYIYSVPVLRSLLKRDADGTLEPDLAESAEIVDGSTIEVVLREGLKFSDGTDLDAAAVKATFDRNLASNNSAGLQILDMQSIETIEVTGPTTLTIRLKTPVAGIAFSLLAGVEFAPVSPAAYAELDAGDGTTVVGAGPMMITRYEPEARVTFEKNPHYWDADNVKLAGMEYIHTVAGSDAITNALISGTTDYSTVSYDQSKGLGGDIEVSTYTMTAPLTMQMCIKDGEPLGDVRVRKALAYAIDRDAFNQLIYDGNSEPAWDLWPANSPWHNPDLDEIYAHDPDRARQLLAEAGYAGGLQLGVLVTAPSARQVEVLQAQFAEVGIELDIVQTTNPLEFYQQILQPTTFSQSRPGPLDKVTRFYLSNSFANACKFQVPNVDALFAELAALPLESEDAIAKWHELQELIVDELAFFPQTVFSLHTVAYNAERVGDLGFYYDQLGGRQPDPVGTYIKR